MGMAENKSNEQEKNTSYTEDKTHIGFNFLFVLRSFFSFILMHAFSTSPLCYFGFIDSVCIALIFLLPYCYCFFMLTFRYPHWSLFTVRHTLVPSERCVLLHYILYRFASAPVFALLQELVLCLLSAVFPDMSFTSDPSLLLRLLASSSSSPSVLLINRPNN